LTALHHVTAVSSDARRTLDFYRDLGFRLVKKTVNFDDPASYHLYFGNDGGEPGSLLTFFEWPGAHRGRIGRGSYTAIGLVSPRVTDVQRIEDPDGLRLELHPGERAGLHHVEAWGRPELYEELVADDAPLGVVPARTDEQGLVGAGTTHHIAWRARDEDEQLAWQEHLREAGLRPTEVLDRKYFRSVYFRLADGLLFEIATDGPGFAVDEPLEALGESLQLPPWLEEHRGAIEPNLAPL